MILEREDIDKLNADVNPEDWTLLIPAAGRGTRLGYRPPKILYPILGRPMLDWLLDIFQDLYKKLIIVVSPEGSASIGEHLGKRSEKNWVLAEQPAPIGMGDAVLRGLKVSDTLYTACVWGDQAALKRGTVVAGMKVLREYERASMTLPTIYSRDPYIHLRRDEKGRITDILQAREGDVMPPAGESDCGLFFMRSSVVLNYFKRMKMEEEEIPAKFRGKQSQEFNFLPILSCLSNVVSLRIISNEEALGVNTRDDAKRISSYLKERV
ncbi:MAG: NTP transferase domain-containing protein [Synergistaceae bacterium]|jgi:bifunctional N-acetylglucosamine-1-phosphate-uridyltransferase/glucosamine-1-phosphate-acetyltransferase GlmU-like protein|nr:NTP transferase domain-containing protein [Synergistaceae bacterium]